MFFRRRSESRKKYFAKIARRNRGRRRLIEALEVRHMLASVAPTTSDTGLELLVTYDAGEDILDLPDIDLYTDENGFLKFEYLDGSDLKQEDVIHEGVPVNLADASYSTYDIDVKLNANGSSDLARLYQNLRGGDAITTLNVGDVTAPGVDLGFSALAISVGSDHTVSTRRVAANADMETAASTGNSGSLKLFAPEIDVDGRLLTHVLDDDTTFSGGDITLESKGGLDDVTSTLVTLPVLPADITVTHAEVELVGATIKGADVTIGVESDASDLFDDETSDGGVAEPLQEWLGSISFGIGVATSLA
ncbi:MAG TPA: hypothetical protein DDW52_03825, partial [Planctomycetaceae bacterium]|nr:hypothetical protein [Planctomycetaceae bacterium]